MKTSWQVSLYDSDLEMNSASNSLLQSDQLAVVLHRLPVPVDTVMTLVELEFAHRPDHLTVRHQVFNRVVEEQCLNSHSPKVGVILSVRGILNPGNMLGLVTSESGVLGQSATLLGSWNCAVCCCLARD